MAESKWYTQKAAASTFVRQAVATGQQELGAVVEGLQSQGVSSKNALKAIYAEVLAGTVSMSGKWSDEKSILTKAGA
jgi:Asp-tRNA(Asn)/Glu-tRNA(Gln) amidotransferase B subunit